MNTPENPPSLDGIVNDIRDERVDDATVAASAARVRARLGLDGAADTAPHVRIESCADFQALIPAFVAGTLRPDLGELLEDHTRECVPCRRALRDARSPRLAPAPVPEIRTGAWRRYAAAAAAVAAVTLGALALYSMGVFSPAARDMQVASIEGSLYGVSGGYSEPLGAGATFAEDRRVRTAKGSSAVLVMADGSRIEMRERTQLSVSRRRDGATILLSQGAIIVEASKQGSGHLDVKTDDCLVSVKGTIFSVNHGTKGSRVSVIEGAVEVRQGGDDRLLEPGEQVSTQPGLEIVSVADEIAWSRNVDQYVAALRELAAVRDAMRRSIQEPPARRRSTLLDHAPAGTVFYAAIPNLTQALGEASRILDDRIASNATFRAWWDEKMGSPENRQRLDEGLAKLRAFGDRIGDEVLITLQMDAAGHVGEPTFLAEPKDPEEFKRFLAREMAARPEKIDLVVRIEDRLLVAGTARDVAAATASPTEPFVGSRFHRRLEDAYRGGAGWLIAADLKTIFAAAHKKAEGRPEAAHLEKMGMLDADTVLFERAPDGDRVRQRVTLDFDAPRRGLASWLAAPAPMGSLSYVSPDASIAAAFVAKDPAEILRELLDIAGGGESGLAAEIDGFRQKTGVDLFRDLAEPLGGDVAVALDGPVLPTPAWKVAFEVDDPARLQKAIETLVRRVNEEVRNQDARDSVFLRSESAGGRVFHTLGTTKTSAEVDYTYDGGYLVAAPSRALLERALQQKTNGYTLATAAGFRALMPRDGEANASALFYENLGPTVGPLVDKAQAALTEEQRRAITDLAREAKPHLACVYAGDRRVVFASDDPDGLGSEIAGLLQAGELSRLSTLLRRGNKPAAAPGSGAAP